MSGKKEQHERVGASLPSRHLEYLDRFPCDRSAAIALCVEYAAKTGFLQVICGEFPTPDEPAPRKRKQEQPAPEPPATPDPFACLDELTATEPGAYSPAHRFDEDGICMLCAELPDSEVCQFCLEECPLCLEDHTDLSDL